MGVEVTEDIMSFGIQRQMIKNSQAGDEQRSPVLEVGEMERPFQTTVLPLPLYPHLSYFADSTFK